MRLVILNYFLCDRSVKSQLFLSPNLITSFHTTIYHFNLVKGGFISLYQGSIICDSRSDENQYLKQFLVLRPILMVILNMNIDCAQSGEFLCSRSCAAPSLRQTRQYKHGICVKKCHWRVSREFK